MPHKRAKASVRNERRKLSDHPVSDKSMGQDAPKGLMRLMKMKETMIENRKNKKNKKTNEKEQLKIQPGERMRDFAQRVEDSYRQDIIQAHKDSKPLTERKKRNREARKERERNKKQRLNSKYGGKDFDDLKDNVKFGEVADAPPTFNKLPKARGQGKQMLEAKTQAAMDPKQSKEKDNGYESEEDENMKQLKASYKRKWSNMSAAAKMALESERERTVALYRAKKAKKMEASGLTPL
ncbi:hypothetical protein DM01DRAFT_1380627 [Hesseltinella vesiculosa]|uniref:Uncharacterized protein n=1 Tax=Hesseltinella vesiculosa TaxID=101127 RepID=A0A1X2GRX8_9FUNG|nr:hypothetical protein DM01DRAFT_1380627 [Hesseltinella vesiculosa]